MNLCAIFEIIKTELDIGFVEKFIERAHADPVIKRVYGIENETVDETKRRVLAFLKLSKILI
jgi:truncated hemoglobin YjbI